MIPKQCKTLIEPDFPIAMLSTHSARETSIRHAPGNNYTVSLSHDLVEWSSVALIVPRSETSINSWTDDGLHPLGPPLQAALRFYRVELLP